MSQDNMFESSEWEPSGNYGKFDDLATIEARRTFSRFSLALFLFLLIANVVVLALSTTMMLVMGATEYAAFVDSSPIFEMLASTLPMYLVAFPVLFLIVRPMPSRKREKKKLPLLELFYMFLVAEAFMMVGNLIGQSITTTISTFFGIEIKNSTADLITEAPIWLVFILVVVVAPIIEEFIFRKLMIDRLSRFGDVTAIIVSAVAFGLFHGNFYQFFYAAFLGLLLGYLYCKSGKIGYTIVFHAIINFLGSVAVIPILKYEELLLSGAIPETGAALREQIIAIIAMASYAIFQYAMVIPGIIIFINAIRYRLINVNNISEIKIPQGKTSGAVILNVGSMLFLVFSLFTFIGSLILG